MAVDRPYSSVTPVRVGGLCCLSGTLPECARLGAQPLGIRVLGQGPTPSTEAPTPWAPGVGPQGALGLKGSSGAWGASGDRTAQGEAWQEGGPSAGILGNPLGQYPQGALHSAAKQLAFRESLWGEGREDCGGSQASPGLGPHLKGLPEEGLGVHRQ